MGSCCQPKHVTILLYFTIFGSAFVLFSALYLFNLIRLEGTPCTSHILLTNFSSSSSSSSSFDRPCFRFMSDWKLTAIVGLSYGILCLLIALTTLGIMCVTHFSRRRANETLIRPKATRGKMAANGHQLVRQKRVNEGRRYWSDLLCVRSKQRFGRTLISLSFWLFSIIVPTYLGVRLVITDALMRDNREDPMIHFPALALFAVSITNLIVIFVTCVSICNDREQDKDFVCPGPEGKAQRIRDVENDENSAFVNVSQPSTSCSSSS